VDNFASLAGKGYFDGAPFHRIVPNFVVQDGDPSGTGWGGPGYEIRDEINSIPYGTGTVGMALSGPDTGGSQWFITHSPQPHLDGRYTVFGQLLEGWDVLERLEQGDRIQSLTVSMIPQ
jgi:cyclophilin family peptidyl-prolyl cis-trans isomerase